MFIVKLMIWLILYPLCLIGFCAVTSFRVLSFLFHSPVDIWTLVGHSLEEQKTE